jgi:hypothetical protein
MNDRFLKDALKNLLHLTCLTYWSDKKTCNTEYESNKCREYFGAGHPCDHIHFCQKSTIIEKAVESL